MEEEQNEEESGEINRRAQWAFVAGGVWVQMASILVLLEGILSGWGGLVIKNVLALFRTQPQFPATVSDSSQHQ